MAQAFSGASGSGSILTYSVPRDHQLRLELLTFTLTTDATAGVHSAEVQFYDTSLNAVTARIWDWNEGGPTMTLYYTFGIGLRPFNCTVTTGMMIPSHLPDTILEPDSQVTLRAVNTAGTVISGDAFSAVTLYGTLFDAVEQVTSPAVDLVPGFLPGEA